MTTFETKDYGKIEVTRACSGDWSGVAYFFSRDWEVEVDATGNFKDLDGNSFRVYYFYDKTKPATLDVMRPVVIAESFPQRLDKVT